MNNFLLIDDHEIVRAGVKNVLLELFKPCDIWEACDEQSALKELNSRKYQLIILDVQLPDNNSVSLMDHIKTRFPETKVLVFSMSSEVVYAKRFLKAGAMGFLSKNSGLGELKKAVDLVLNNRKYISEYLAEQLASDIGKDQAVNPFDKLSPREFEITSLLIAGKKVKEISTMLYINASTIGTYKVRLFDKLGVKTLPELIEIGKIYNIK